MPFSKDFPTELVEICAQKLEISDLNSFRLTSRQINAQISHVVRQRFFKTLKTSLMGSDLGKLEEISMNDNVRKYVKYIHVEDDYVKMRSGIIAPHPNKPLYIWPRDQENFLKLHEIAVANLRKMLSEKRFNPETIRVRETCMIQNPGSAAILLQELLYGADPAMLSLRVWEELHLVTGAIARLSPQYQGQSVVLSMLHTVEFCFVEAQPPSWSDQLFYDAPIFEKVAMGIMDPWRQDSLLLVKSPMYKLRRLNLFQLSLPAHIVLQVLVNSKSSLADLNFNMVRLSAGSTWRELLLSIGRDFPLLSSLKLRCLLQTSGYIRFEHLNIEPVAEQYDSKFEIGGSSEADGAITWVHYDGTRGDEVLRAVARCAVASLESED